MNNGRSKTLNGWREIKVIETGRKIGEEKKVKEKQLYIVSPVQFTSFYIILYTSPNILLCAVLFTIIY